MLHTHTLGDQQQLAFTEVYRCQIKMKKKKEKKREKRDRETWPARHMNLIIMIIDIQNFQEPKQGENLPFVTQLTGDQVLGSLDL